MDDDLVQLGIDVDTERRRKRRLDAGKLSISGAPSTHMDESLQSRKRRRSHTPGEGAAREEINASIRRARERVGSRFR